MASALVLLVLACHAPPPGERRAEPSGNAEDLTAVLAEADRIPNSSGWFEVLRLPHRVYAFWEPGHAEKVNAFLILGSRTDLLYDTGMGIASLRSTIDEVREAERLPARDLLVVNSHNHLDHNGGNREFATVHTVDDPWARRRLQLGVPAGEAGGFVAYWADLTPHPGVVPPAQFDPQTHAIPPYPLDQVRYLTEGQRIDLGDRKLQVLRTYSHSPDGVALFEPGAGLFFGGDAFYGANYLVTDLAALAVDLRRIERLPIRWHYSSHGPQLITAMQQGAHLATVERMLAGDGTNTTTSFAGFSFPMRELDGVRVTLARELLLY
ncbi:MAG: MBL fold metallo-hydrolase [Pseudomonadota bacterium]